METIIAVIFRVCAGLSLFGSIFTILVYFGYKDLQNVPFFLVVCMQIGDSFKSISLILPQSKKISCDIQGFLNNYGALSSILWSSIIANSIYESVVINENSYTFRKIYLIIGFILPLPISALPIITDSYKEEYTYCWIYGQYKYIWRSCCLFIFIASAVIFNYRRYRIIINELVEDSYADQRSVMIIKRKSIARKLYLYPLVVVACFAPSLVYLIVQAFWENTVILVICASLQFLFGLANTLLYVCRRDILVAVKDTLFCKKAKTNNSPLIMEDNSANLTFMNDFYTNRQSHI